MNNSNSKLALILALSVFIIPLAEAANKKPSVKAGGKQTVNEQTTVTLKGSASDKDGSISSYLWQQTKGVAVTLTGTDTAKPSFTAPTLTKSATLAFKLTVTDDLGAVASATTSVLVKPVNAKPIANAGSNKTVGFAVPVTLDGSQSQDSDGTLSYQWKQSSGVSVKLANAQTATPSFKTPAKLKGSASYSELVFTLTVTDNEKAKAKANVSVWVTGDNAGANVNPIAKPGADRNVAINSQVSLDASPSKDPDGSIASYLWEQTSGTAVTLSNANTAIASFTAPTVTTDTKLGFKLTVTDNQNARNSSNLNITVKKPLVAPTVTVQATNQRVILTWTAVSGASQYNICFAAATLTDPYKCKTTSGNGTLLSKQTSPTTVTGLTNNQTYYFVVIAANDVSSQASTEITAIPKTIGALNDTGITRCATDKTNGLLCPQSTFPKQDADYGLDAKDTNDSDGEAGFSFTRVSVSSNSQTWACVKDNVTGLIWEKKTTDGGLHDRSKAYTHLNSTESGYGSSPDASAFINAVNSEKLCGYSDWRLPSVDELLSLVHFGIGAPEPTIDPTFFGDVPAGSTANNNFITSSAKSGTASANNFTVDFYTGEFSFSDRSTANAVRLVRTDNTTVTERFAVNGDEVTDIVTGLIWRRCSEGLSWDGTSCTGTTKKVTLAQALSNSKTTETATAKAWRLPNIKELNSLATLKANNTTSIDTNSFPSTSTSAYWSSSPVYSDATYGWVFSFASGSKPTKALKAESYAVRLVRDK